MIATTVRWTTILILQIKKLMLLKSQKHSRKIKKKKQNSMKEDLLYKRPKHRKLN